MGKTEHEAGEIERKQAITLARAAANVTGLEHYIWSTLPSATKQSNSKHPVPHLDYKAEVDEYIQQELKDLAKKTTYLLAGFYPSNLVLLPFLQPVEWVSSSSNGSKSTFWMKKASIGRHHHPYRTT